MMRPVAILKILPAVPAGVALASAAFPGAAATGTLGAVGAGAATGAATGAASTGVGAGIGASLMQGAKKKIGQVGVTDAASIAQNASDKATERAQQAQQNNIQSSQDMADKAKEKADTTLKGEYYPPSIGGYLEQRYTGGTQDGVETNKKIKPGGEVTRNPGGEVPPPGSNATYLSPEWQTNIERLSNQQQYGYDIPQKQLPVAVQPTEAPVESFTGELPDSTWSSYDNHGLQQLKDRERIYENEHQEVMNRITESLREYLNPDGTYKKGVPTQFAIRTHILDEQRKGVGLDKRGNEKSNGDSIVAIINPHLDDPTKPALRTVMLRNSEFSTDTTPQPFSPSSAERETGLKNVQKVIHADGMSKRERDVRFKAAKKIRRDNGIRELNTNIVQTGEPMDIAMRLLKERKGLADDYDDDDWYNDDLPRETYQEVFEEAPPEVHPGHMESLSRTRGIGTRHGTELGSDYNIEDISDKSLVDQTHDVSQAYHDAYMSGEYDPGEFGPWWQGLPKRGKTLGSEFEDEHLVNQFRSEKRPDGFPVRDIIDIASLSGKEVPLHLQTASLPDETGEVTTAPSFYGMPFNEKTGFTMSEPMDIALRLLKESVHLTHNEDLPHQFSQDIANLDNRHEIAPTKTGSAINNIHPNMLRTIQLMAENYQDNTPVQEEVYEPPTYF